MRAIEDDDEDEDKDEDPAEEEDVVAVDEFDDEEDADDCDEEEGDEEEEVEEVEEVLEASVPTPSGEDVAARGRGASKYVSSTFTPSLLCIVPIF